MAGPILTRAATAPLTRSFVFAPPSRVYAKDDNSAERGLPIAWQNMQRHEIRHRHRQEPADNDDSSVTVEELTPASSDDHAETEEDAGQAQHNAFIEPRKHLGKLRRQPLSETESQDSIAALRKAEYDKIRPHMLEKDHVAGLPRLAALQDSNDSFCIFRKFGPVAVRILVGKEIELEQLVTRLNELDEKDSKNPETSYRLKSIDFYEGCDPEQKDLMEKIEDRLKDYYDFLTKYVDIREFSPVNPRHHRSVHTWMIDNRPLLEGEDAFIFSADDFIAARRMSVHDFRFRMLVEEQADRCIQRLLNGKTERSRTNNQYVHHYSTSSLEVAAKIIASFVAVGILLIPVFILFLFDLSRAKMAAIVGSFVLVFMVTMAVLVDVTPHDLFIGIAA
ncbi:hypothetical protein N431DRAFT_325452 [Stipitochalara longipes BDJ]|nr:hypothetical protein N431DRAFT_325452 [Stipitochalara longipes BDJ]